MGSKGYNFSNITNIIFSAQDSDSDSDLIQLDSSQGESSPKLEDFDPLKCMDKSERAQQNKGSTDSALLHEYGLDFSGMGMWDYYESGTSDNITSSSQSPVPKGWTTFQ